MQRKFIDSSTEEGTRKLCHLIIDHWKSKGFDKITAVPEYRKTEVVEFRKNKDTEEVTRVVVNMGYYAIKSNLGPTGFPPR